MYAWSVKDVPCDVFDLLINSLSVHSLTFEFIFLACCLRCGINFSIYPGKYVSTSNTPLKNLWLIYYCRWEMSADRKQRVLHRSKTYLQFQYSVLQKRFRTFYIHIKFLIIILCTLRYSLTTLKIFGSFPNKCTELSIAFDQSAIIPYKPIDKLMSANINSHHTSVWH